MGTPLYCRKKHHYKKRSSLRFKENTRAVRYSEVRVQYTISQGKTPRPAPALVRSYAWQSQVHNAVQFVNEGHLAGSIHTNENKRKKGRARDLQGKTRNYVSWVRPHENGHRFFSYRAGLLTFLALAKRRLTLSLNKKVRPQYVGAALK